MSVKIREKVLADGNISLYLDIYHDGKRRYEFMKLQLYKKPRTAIEISHNKETKKLADSIAGKTQIEIQAGRYGLAPAFKRNINFLAYYSEWVKQYPNKDIRIARYSYEHFKEFVKVDYKDSITPREITEELCRSYKKYLEKNLNGETPYNYFTKFKKALNQATKEKIFIENPASNIKNTKQEGLKKDILSIEEIQTLAKSYCGNENVKRAFLFSLNTGLRWCDIVNLEWKQIDGQKMKTIQQKTKGEVIIDLNITASKLIGKRGKSDEKIFDLPSHTGCLKSLKQWTLNAGIDKNITWHCSRHSFAVNLLGFNNDIKSVASLLGHTGLRHTEKYTRVIDILKKKAVNTLPEIDL